MNLQNYFDRYVYVVCADARVFRGYVTCYFTADENGNGKDSIIVDTDNSDAVELYEDDISVIRILR
jgi:hypothetical protein